MAETVEKPKSVKHWIVLELEAFSDGHLFVVSRAGVDGLILSAKDADSVWRDLGPTIQLLLARNYNWPSMTERLRFARQGEEPPDA